MKNKFSKSLSVLFMIVFADMIGFGLIIPLLPYYVEIFNPSPFVAGLLLAAYPMGQLFGAPLVGRLSDKYGRKKLLFVSVAGTFASLMILGFAGSLIVVFLARLVDGLTGGNITVAQAYITDISDEKDRAKRLGMIGAAFGLGFVIGPAVGGFLSGFSYGTPIFFAAGLAVFNLMMIYFVLQESLSINKTVKEKKGKKVLVNFSSLVKALKKPQVGMLLITSFIYSFGFGIFQAIFGFYAKDKLGLTSQTTGYVFAYIGILIAFSQGFLIGVLTKRFSELKILFFSLGVVSITLIGWALAPNLGILLIFLAPMALVGGLVAVMIRTLLTKSVDKNEIGGTLGLAVSLESLSRVLAPIIGGILIAIGGNSLPGIFSSIIIGSLLIILLIRNAIKNNAVKSLNMAITNVEDKK